MDPEGPSQYDDYDYDTTVALTVAILAQIIAGSNCSSYLRAMPFLLRLEMNSLDTWGLRVRPTNAVAARGRTNTAAGDAI